MNNKLGIFGWIIAAILGALYFFDFKPKILTPEHYNIIGRVENAYIDEVDIPLKARIDSGAGVTSLNAKIIKIHKSKAKGEPDQVTFEIENEDGEKKTLTKDVLEWMRIKKIGLDEFISRPVVKMDICLGGRKIAGRVNLSDRSQFIYPVLIGRNFLKTGDFLVNPKRKFTNDHGCK